MRPQLPTALQARTVPARNQGCACFLVEGSLGAQQNCRTGGKLGKAQGRNRKGPESCPPGPTWHQCCLPTSKVSPVPGPPRGVPAAPLPPSLICGPASACPSAPKCRPPLVSGAAAYSLLTRPPLPPPRMAPGTSPAPFLRPVRSLCFCRWSLPVRLLPVRGHPSPVLPPPWELPGCLRGS